MSIVTWTTPGEQPPGPGATLQEVAASFEEYLFGELLWELPNEKRLAWVQSECHRCGLTLAQVEPHLRTGPLAGLIPRDVPSDQPIEAPGIALVGEHEEGEDARVLAVIARFEAEFKRCQTLSPDGTFDPSVVSAYAYAAKKASKNGISLLDTFRTKALKAGVEPVEVHAFIRAVDRRVSGRAIRLVTAKEILNMPDPRFLIRDLMEEGGLSVLYGESNIGKSLVGMAWSLCVAAGIPWWGRDVIQGPVVYVGAEGVGGFPKRLEALLQYYGLDEPPPDLYFILQAVNLLDARSVAEAIQAAEEMNVSPVLVVFDTYARSLVGGDENSAKNAGLAIQAMDDLRFKLHTAVMVIHHTGKTGTSERGSGALRGASDTMFLLVRAPDGNLTLTVDKQKNFEAAPPITIRLQHIGESVVPVEVVDARSMWLKAVEDSSDAPGGKRDGKREGLSAEIIEFVRKAESEGRTPMTQNEIVLGVKGATSTIADVLHELAADSESPVVMMVSGKKKLYSIRPS